MSDELVMPAEIAAQIHKEMIDRVADALIARAPELARVARNDPDPGAFAKAWRAAAEQAIAEAQAHAHEQIEQWSATEQQWRTPQ